MKYFTINCKKKKDCEKILIDSLCDVCRNMDEGVFKWNDAKIPREGWLKYGILVNGDRKLIDAATPVKKPTAAAAGTEKAQARVDETAEDASIKKKKKGFIKRMCSN